uniref:LysR family transcriptional regulator n=1 Tax=Novispirillum itersonii TaxID=189 RepID=UPI0003608223
MAVDLRHIRYFLAVAEERNFTRAAERMGIGQPPLSTQIRDLEEEIGARLFYRLPHGADLTDAGKAFHDLVRTLPDRVAEATEAARRAARGETGQLRLGFTGTAALNPITTGTIRTYRRACPGVDLRVQEQNSMVLLDQIRSGDLDIAIIRANGGDAPDLKLDLLYAEPLVAALPDTTPTEGEDGPLDLTSLRDQPIILTPPTVGESLRKAALDACAAAGFTASLGQPAPQIASILSLVAAELGFSLVPASVEQLRVSGVRYRRLTAPEPTIGLAVVIPAHNPAVTAITFRRIALDTARAQAC